MVFEESRRLRAIEAAYYLRVSRSTLAKWRMSGGGPPYHRCGPRLIYYFQHEIDAWLAACDANARPCSVKAR
jgi:predicted DNA-binding transcriptional regulator AlpA